MSTNDNYLLNLENHLKTLSENEFNLVVEEMYQQAIVLIKELHNIHLEKQKQLTF